MLICLECKVVSLFETGEHVTSARPPHSPNLTAAQKDFAKQMARAGIFLVWLGFGFRWQSRCWQRVGREAVRRWLFNESTPAPSCARASLSFFMWTQPTTQTRLATLSLSAASPMRQDLSICWRCSSLPSSEKATTQRLWQHCAGFTAKLCEELRVKYVMGDTDAAQYNALARVFIDCQFTHLMCYYHLIAKVVDRTKGLPKELGDAVLRDVYDMHYSRSSEALTTVRVAAELRWQKNPLLQNFIANFKRTWLNEKFCRWQCFQTPPGFAITNKPVEQFNRAFKRDYAAHRLLKIGELLQQIAACCRQRSIDIRPFALCPSASKELLARVKALRNQKLLREYVVPRMSVDFLLLDSYHGCNARLVHTTCSGLQLRHEHDAGVSASFSSSGAKHRAERENENQPETGWPVDMVNQTCPCDFHFKYANCVHRLFAMQERERINGNGDEVLVNRRVSKRKRASVGHAPTAAGRPPHAGHALQRE